MLHSWSWYCFNKSLRFQFLEERYWGRITLVFHGIADASAHHSRWFRNSLYPFFSSSLICQDTLDLKRFARGKITQWYHCHLDYAMRKAFSVPYRGWVVVRPALLFIFASHLNNLLPLLCPVGFLVWNLCKKRSVLYIESRLFNIQRLKFHDLFNYRVIRSMWNTCIDIE